MFASRRRLGPFAVFAAPLVLSFVGCGAPPPASGPQPLGRYDVRAESLPAPYLTADASNPPKVVARPDGAELLMPPGFAAAPYAEGKFERPRMLALAPNGDVFVAESEGDRITVLRDANKDGTAEERFLFATGLNKPFGMAFWREYFYVANTNAIVRFRYAPGQATAEGEPEKIADLPGRGYREHWTRNILFNPEGTKLYVTVGSESNVDVEPEPRASILEFNPDGTGGRVYAAGTRNPVGLAWNATTNKLWASVQERDRLGDDLPPDYVTEVVDGGFYGWPYSYAGKIEDPRHAGERPDLVAQSLVPDVLLQAHSAVLGLQFYTGTMFPEEFRGDAFAALHGSWNRAKRTGYKIVRIPMENGRPRGGYEDFVAGWMLDENRSEVWGRPVGLLVLPDGSMLITDDGANVVWRITYRA